MSWLSDIRHWLGWLRPPKGPQLTIAEMQEHSTRYMEDSLARLHGLHAISGPKMPLFVGSNHPEWGTAVIDSPKPGRFADDGDDWSEPAAPYSGKSLRECVDALPANLARAQARHEEYLNTVGGLTTGRWITSPGERLI